MPRASSLAAAIENESGSKVELIKGSRGAFEIKVDGELIFSKLAEDRFPEEGEILAHFT